MNKRQGMRRVLSAMVLGMGISTSAMAANNIVAVVGRQVVTQQELQQRVTQVRTANAGQTLPADLRRQVLESLVGERAQLQAAMDMGVQVNEADVDQAQQRVAAQNGLTVAQLLQRVAGDGLSEAGYRQQLRDQLMMQRVRERVLDQRLSITPSDIRNTLEEASAQKGSQTLELAQVLVQVPERATVAQRAALQAQAEEIAKRAQAGEDLVTLAQAHQLQAVAGSLGLKPSEAYPALFLDATRALPVGGVSTVVSSGAGFHVLKVVQRERALGALSVVQTHARHILRRAQAEAQRQAAATLLNRVRADIQAGRVTFEAAAAQWGEDGSAAHGGDLGWAQPGQFVPAFEAAMNALQPGVISQAIETEFGVHLLEVVARRQVPMSDAQQRAWAEQRLRQEKGQQILDAWTREVRASSYVHIQDPDLR